MNPWLIILLAAIILVACVMGFYVILTQIILFIARRHVDKTLKKYTERAEAILPGINCGKCGCSTCHEYAKAMVHGQEEDLTRCTEGGEEVVAKLKECLGELDKLTAPEAPINPDATEDTTI